MDALTFTPVGKRRCPSEMAVVALSSSPLPAQLKSTAADDDDDDDEKGEDYHRIADTATMTREGGYGASQRYAVTGQARA